MPALVQKAGANRAELVIAFDPALGAVTLIVARIAALEAADSLSALPGDVARLPAIEETGRLVALEGDVAWLSAVIAGHVIVAVIVVIAFVVVSESVAQHHCVALSRLREFALQDAMADTAVMGIC